MLRLERKLYKHSDKVLKAVKLLHLDFELEKLHDNIIVWGTKQQLKNLNSRLPKRKQKRQINRCNLN